MVPRALVNNSARSVRMTFKDINLINTGAGGFTTPTFALGIATTGGNSALGTVVPRMATMAGLYRQFYLNSVTFRWIPCASTSAAGTVAMGIDQAVNASIASGIGQVYHHVPSTMSDIKAACAITFTGKQALKTDYKYTSTLTGLDEESFSFGVFQSYVTGPVSTQVGVIEIIVDVTYTGPV